MTTHKRLGMILDYKLSYENDLQSVNSKINKTIGLLRKIQPSFEKISCGIYKTFIRPHLHYGDVVFDRPSKETRHQGLKFLQYSREVVITGAISETSSEKLSQALHLETLK